MIGTTQAKDYSILRQSVKLILQWANIWTPYYGGGSSEQRKMLRWVVWEETTLSANISEWSCLHCQCGSWNEREGTWYGFSVLEDALVFNPDVFLDWGWCSMHIASFPISEPPQLVPHPISIHQRLYSLKCMPCIPSPFHQYNMKCNPISIHQRLYSLKCISCNHQPFHHSPWNVNPSQSNRYFMHWNACHAYCHPFHQYCPILPDIQTTIFQWYPKSNHKIFDIFTLLAGV